MMEIRDKKWRDVWLEYLNLNRVHDLGIEPPFLGLKALLALEVMGSMEKQPTRVDDWMFELKSSHHVAQDVVKSAIKCGVLIKENGKYWAQLSDDEIDNLDPIVICLWDLVGRGLLERIREEV